MEAQKLPPITTIHERASGSIWLHQKILLVIMVLPECGIVLNRCIANRYSILVQPLLSMSRGICVPAISPVAAKVFSAPAKSPPLLATTKHRCTRYFPLSHCFDRKSRSCSRIERRSLTPLKRLAQLLTTRRRTRRPFDPHISSATVRRYL